MPRGDTSSFFQFINDQNERMLAREAAEERKVKEEIGTDEIREDRMAEYREKWDGDLRARPRRRGRSKRVSPKWDTLSDGGGSGGG